MSDDRLTSKSVALGDGSAPVRVLRLDDACAQQRILDLEREVAQLRQGLVSRQRVGVATGLVAERLGVSPDNAFAMLRAASQTCNVKLRDVARLVVDAHSGQLAEAEVPLADDLNYLIFGQYARPATPEPGQ
jgi:hypothetical protein